MTDPNIREYRVGAASTDVFGRVLVNARNHHFVIDGPVQNGCPGEAVTPVEAFLSGIAACAVELVQVIGRERETPPRAVHASVRARIDRSRPVRADYSVFNTVEVDFEIEGVSADDGHTLVEAFKRR
jgi:uncharacterized OsmC-like protein